MELSETKGGILGGIINLIRSMVSMGLSISGGSETYIGESVGWIDSVSGAGITGKV